MFLNTKEATRRGLIDSTACGSRQAGRGRLTVRLDGRELELAIRPLVTTDRRTTHTPRPCAPLYDSQCGFTWHPWFQVLYPRVQNLLPRLAGRPPPLAPHPAVRTEADVAESMREFTQRRTRLGDEPTGAGSPGRIVLAP